MHIPIFPAGVDSKELSLNRKTSQILTPRSQRILWRTTEKKKTDGNLCGHRHTDKNTHTHTYQNHTLQTGNASSH